MRARLAALLLAALTLLPLAAPVRGDEKKNVLPLNPWAKAAEGDWSTLVFHVKVDAGQGENPLADQMPEMIVVTWKVQKVEDHEVTVVSTARPGAGDERSHEYSTKEPPTVEKLLDVQEPERVSDYKVTDEKKTVGGREFACKKVTFTTTNAEQHVKQESTLWLSSEVKGSGIVAIATRTVEGPLKLEVHVEVAGIGSKDKVEWGKKADAIEVKGTPPPPEGPRAKDGENPMVRPGKGHDHEGTGKAE